jgi:hypothetical protein
MKWIFIAGGMMAMLAVAAVLLANNTLFAKSDTPAAENPAPAKPTPPEKNVKVTGEVVDLWCYISAGARGEGHKECAVACATAGNPIGLVDAKGRVYLLLGKDMHKPDREGLIKNMAATVTITGTLHKGNGVRALYIDTIEVPAK